MSCNQASFCLYTLRTISDRAEETFERLRYFLGGDRPSQTAHLTVFQDLIQGLWLGSQYYKGGRNLPDKEFRYLRTVIVTAAVYWGLSSLLRLL